MGALLVSLYPLPFVLCLRWIRIPWSPFRRHNELKSRDVRRRHHSWGPEGHFFVISRRDGRVERTESATFKNRALDNISSDYYSLINSLLCIFDSFFYDISTGRPGVATIDGVTVMVMQSAFLPWEKLLPLRRILRSTGTKPTSVMSIIFWHKSTRLSTRALQCCS